MGCGMRTDTVWTFDLRSIDKMYSLEDSLKNPLNKLGKTQMPLRLSLKASCP